MMAGERTGTSRLTFTLTGPVANLERFLELLRDDEGAAGEGAGGSTPADGADPTGPLLAEVYLGHMDEHVAVHLAYDVLAHVRRIPAALDGSPIVVIADVLASPPWSLDFHDATAFVGRALRTREDAAT